LWQRTRAPKVIVLGELMAEAQRAEDARLAKPGIAASPFGPDLRYDRWFGDIGLSDPVPCRVDDELRAFCRRFAAADPLSRARVRESTSMDDFYTLLEFSRRSAVFGLRSRDAGYFVDGLSAIAIIDVSRIDHRDAQVALELLDFAARAIETNPGDFFKRAASLAEPRMSQLILACSKRLQGTYDLHGDCGYAMIETEAGPGFVHWNLEPYQPSYPMDKIALALADFVKRDKYQPTFITLASKLPAVWLSSVDDPVLNRTLKSVRAGISVTAELRPSESPDYAYQHLMIFLVELKDEADAASLLRLYDEIHKQPTRVALAGLKEGRLFCLAIGRAWVVGKAPFETTETMQRFSAGIAQLLKRYVQT
jgi:hypothetical protein